jgi:hypothetical protein
VWNTSKMLERVRTIYIACVCATSALPGPGTHHHPLGRNVSILQKDPELPDKVRDYGRAEALWKRKPVPVLWRHLSRSRSAK